jgi:hypothetical protein
MEMWKYEINDTRIQIQPAAAIITPFQKEYAQKAAPIQIYFKISKKQLRKGNKTTELAQVCRWALEITNNWMPSPFG